MGSTCAAASAPRSAGASATPRQPMLIASRADAKSRRPRARMVIEGSSPAVRELFGPADQPVDRELPAIGAHVAAPAAERAHAAGLEQAEVQARRVRGHGLEHEVDGAGVRRGHAPGLPPLARVVLPVEVLHHLVEAAVPEDAVLVRAGAGGPLRAEVDAEADVAGEAGRDAPVPERAVGPDAAAPVLDAEARARIEAVAARAGAHLAL